MEWGEKSSKVGMPKFRMQKINSALSLWVNEPEMLGTLADPSEKPGHVWVAFATVFEVVESEKTDKKEKGSFDAGGFAHRGVGGGKGSVRGGAFSS